MSHAIPLPSRPNAEQYRKLAKDLQHACQSEDPAAIQDWATRLIRTRKALRWAIHSWEIQQSRADRCYETIALLVRAGAEPDPNWFTSESRPVFSDTRMQRALRGEWAT